MIWTMVAKSALAATAVAPFETPVSELWADPMSLVSRTRTVLCSSAEDIDPFSSRYMTRLYGLEYPQFLPSKNNERPCFIG